MTATTTATSATASAASPLTREELTSILNEGHECTLESSGRTLGYLLVGKDLLSSSKAGDDTNVVVLCNGSPASRLEAKVYARDAKNAGVCFVCVDRYGYGKSDLPEKEEDRSILHFARDVDELVTDHLGIASYGVIGASAGGVNALALLYVASSSSPKKIKKAALVAPAGPIYQTTTKGMSGFFRLFLWLGKFAPSVVAFMLRTMLAGNRERYLRDPAYLDTQVDGFTANSSKFDRRYLESLDRETLRYYALSQAEVFRNDGSVDGVNSLNTLLTQPWGFDIQDIRGIEVDIFASHDDDIVPLTMAEHIAHQLGDAATMHRCHQEGHVSVIGRKMNEALQAILS